MNKFFQRVCKREARSIAFERDGDGQSSLRLTALFFCNGKRKSHHRWSRKPYDRRSHGMSNLVETASLPERLVDEDQSIPYNSDGYSMVSTYQ